MNKKKIQRVISLVLCLAVVASSAAISVFAEENVLLSAPVTAVTSTQKPSSVTDATIDDVKEILDSMSYAEYFDRHSTRVEKTDENGKVVSERVWAVDAGKEAIVIDAVKDIYEAGTDAKWEKVTYGGVESILTPGSGTVAWQVSIPETARYSILIEYYPVDVDSAGNVISKATDIERILRINSAVPFLEARYLTLPKTYVNDYANGEYLVGEDDDQAALMSRAAELGLIATTEKRENATYIIFEMPAVWTEGIYQYLCEELKARFFT